MTDEIPAVICSRCQTRLTDTYVVVRGDRFCPACADDKIDELAFDAFD